MKKIKELRSAFDYLKIITQVLFHFNFWHLKYFQTNYTKSQSENFFLIKESKTPTKDGFILLNENSVKFMHPEVLNVLRFFYSKFEML